MTKLRRGGAELTCDRCTLKLTASNADVLKSLAEQHAAERHPTDATGFQGLQRIALNAPPTHAPPPPPPRAACDAHAAVHLGSYHAKLKLPGDHDCIRMEGIGHEGQHRCTCGYKYDDAQRILIPVAR